MSEVINMGMATNNNRLISVEDLLETALVDTRKSIVNQKQCMIILVDENGIMSSYASNANTREQISLCELHKYLCLRRTTNNG